MPYFVASRKYLTLKSDAPHYFDARPLLTQYAAIAFQMPLNTHLAHEVAQVAYNIALFLVHFFRIYSSKNGKKTNPILCNNLSKRKNVAIFVCVLNLINRIIVFIEEDFTSIIRFWRTRVNSNGWHYVIFTVMKLQNYLRLSHIKCSLENIFMEWYQFITTKLFHNFLHDGNRSIGNDAIVKYQTIDLLK